MGNFAFLVDAMLVAGRKPALPVPHRADFPYASAATELWGRKAPAYGGQDLLPALKPERAFNHSSFRLRGYKSTLGRYGAEGFLTSTVPLPTWTWKPLGGA